MKRRKIALRNFAILSLTISCFIACDKDFVDIESDIINNDNASHFGTDSRKLDVIAYTKVLGPVQTNSLPTNLLGVYNDPNESYGQTVGSVVTQLRGNLTDPDFGTNAVIDSVVLTIPYFSTPTGVDEDGGTTYELDSIFGAGKFDLSIYESNYFLRDFNPNSSEINSPQEYYANMSTEVDLISDVQLEGELLYQKVNFDVDPSQIVLTEGEGDDKVVTSRTSPAIRIKFDDAGNDYWQEKIIDKAGQPELSNINNFNNYFRGLYFKAKSNDSPGKMLLLNMASNSSNIIIYYTRDPFTAGADPVQSTYTFTFGNNRINFLKNDFSISSGDEVSGSENLYLKGTQGSVGEIKLFNGDNIDLNDPADNSFEAFKNEFVDTDINGNFVSSKKLINEANLVFYVDQDLVEDEEPERLYLYDSENNIPLADYFLDNANTSFPSFSRINHLGRLQREGGLATGPGVKYKIKITEHINNLLLRDSTNVKLGLAVSGNINLESNAIQFDVLTGNSIDEKIPVSSIITPRGTVLYGNNTSNSEKKLYLEIFFTEPNN